MDRRLRRRKSTRTFEERFVEPTRATVVVLRMMGVGVVAGLLRVDRRMVHHREQQQQREEEVNRSARMDSVDAAVVVVVLVLGQYRHRRWDRQEECIAVVEDDEQVHRRGRALRPSRDRCRLLHRLEGECLRGAQWVRGPRALLGCMLEG